MKAPKRTHALLAATALALAVLATGCGSDAEAGTRPAVAADHTAHEHHPAESADDGDGILEVTARDFAFISEHATVTAGRVPVQFTNEGGEPHQLQIGRLHEPMTPEEFIELYDEQGDRASVEALTWVGGVNVMDPGETGSARVELTEGDYLMVCYVPDDDGTSHVMRGMVAALHVSAPTTSASSESGRGDEAEPAEAVVLRDYQIVLPPGFRGRGEVAFRNEGTDPHEVVLLQLDPGKALADAAAYQSDPTADQPFSFAGGVASVAPGTQAVASLDLEPGDYIATCFVPSADGTPHIDLGMLATFTVT
ncbi:MAG: hypothetical protein ACTHN0_12960 [Aquihabitans sp.]